MKTQAIKYILVAVVFFVIGIATTPQTVVNPVEVKANPDMFHEIYDSDNALIDNLIEQLKLENQAVLITANYLNTGKGDPIAEFASMSASLVLKQAEAMKIQETRKAVMLKWKTEIEK